MARLRNNHRKQSQKRGKEGAGTGMRTKKKGIKRRLFLRRLLCSELSTPFLFFFKVARDIIRPFFSLFLFFY
jgi:hypothetical protein